MSKKIKLLIPILITGLLFFGNSGASIVNASEAKTTMTITPPIEKIVLVPGEIYEGTIRVSNSATASQILDYSVYVGSFGLREDENGNTDYDNTDIDTITDYNQIIDWITLDKESGKVAPNKSDTVTFSIVVPEDAPAGGQYASIIVRNNTNDNEGDDGNVMIQNVVEFATTIIAEVAGKTREEGTITNNSMPSFLLSSPLQATSMVKNNGNVHTDASYVLQVWPLFSDEEICTNEEEPSTSLIMPDTERYHTESCNLPSVGIFRAKQTVSIFGETSIVEKTIIVCPLWLLFLIIFAVVAIIFWLIMKAHSRKSSKSRKASAE